MTIYSDICGINDDADTGRQKQIFVFACESNASVFYQNYMMEKMTHPDRIINPKGKGAKYILRAVYILTESLGYWKVYTLYGDTGYVVIHNNNKYANGYEALYYASMKLAQYDNTVQALPRLVAT